MHCIIYNIDKKQKQGTFCEILRETGDGSLSPFSLSPSLNLGQDILKLSVIYESIPEAVADVVHLFGCQNPRFTNCFVLLYYCNPADIRNPLVLQRKL